jgi:hypothetical protein
VPFPDIQNIGARPEAGGLIRNSFDALIMGFVSAIAAYRALLEA